MEQYDSLNTRINTIKNNIQEIIDGDDIELTIKKKEYMMELENAMNELKLLKNKSHLQTDVGNKVSNVKMSQKGTRKNKDKYNNKKKNKIKDENSDKVNNTGNIEDNMLLKANICRNFMYNKCDREDCKYIHPINLCFYFWKYDSCKYNNKCKLLHEYKFDIKEDMKKAIKEEVKNNKTIVRQRKVRNTECFEPMTKPVDLRVVLDLRSSSDISSQEIPQLTSRDVLLSPKLFDDYEQYEIYNKLIYEIENCGIPQEKLLRMWHGNDKIDGTHLIADDHLRWKENCPTFNMVINRIKGAFNMDIKATRFNWYRDPEHWKAFHKDSSAINPERALTQNFTVAVSFGATKDAAFEYDNKTKIVISMPQPDCTVYSFTNDTNYIWRHGILQNKTQELGRISIIAWGWIDNVKQIS
jgi:hypothetical protein